MHDDFSNACPQRSAAPEPDSQSSGSPESSDCSTESGAEASEPEQRLELLETKIAFQERTIQQLNDQMYQQQKQIDRLTRVVTDLSNRVKTALTDVEIDDTAGANNKNLDSEVPPHY